MLMVRFERPPIHIQHFSAHSAPQFELKRFKMEKKEIEMEPFLLKNSLPNLKTDFPLHYYAKMGNEEKFAKCLNKENLEAKDGFERTPLHWAATSDNLENGVKCLKKLLEFLDPNNESVDYPKSDKGLEMRKFIDSKDINGEGGIHLAAKNGAAEFVEELLIRSAKVNTCSKSGEVALALIYEHTSSAVVHLLDKGVAFIQDDLNVSSSARQYRLNFEPIVGKVKKANKRRSKLKSKVKAEEEEAPKQDLTLISRETELLNFVKEGREAISKEILTHPLTRIFLELKWRRIRPFFYLSVCFHSIWLALYGWYTIEVYYATCQPSNLEGSSGRNYSCWEYPFDEGESGKEVFESIWNVISNKDTLLRPAILLIISVFFCSKELFQLTSLGREYIKLENVMQWLFVTSLFLILFPSKALFYYQYQIVAVGTLFAAFLLLDVVNKLTNWGIYFKVLLKVTKRFMESTPLFFVIMITFAVSLHMIFPEAIPSLFAFRDALMTIFLMMMGKVNYEEYREGLTTHFPVTGLILFVLFYVMITILLLRILMGFIVSDTQRLLQVVEIDQISTRLEQMYLKETFLLTKLPRWLSILPGSSKFTKILTKILVLPPNASDRFVNVKESDLPVELQGEIRTLASKNPHFKLSRMESRINLNSIS